ncbi:MAG: prolyl oligopeptidase family serine peptidase [Candidatus Cryptobacteroides sp.]
MEIVAGVILIAGGAIVIFRTMFKNSEPIDEEGCISRSEIVIENGVMTPEALLAFGRLSDPQVSPDGTKILYGVSYNSVPDNRSCRNLFICGTDGSNPCQLTKSGKSISNARWSADCKKILFLRSGQIHIANLKWKSGEPVLKNVRKISDIPNGISEFKLSPDQTEIMYISTVKGGMKTPADCWSDLDKATAYSTDDLMYRHWDHWVTEIPHTFIAKINLKKTRKVQILPETSSDILENQPYELPIEPFGGLEQTSWHPEGRFIAYSCKKLTGKKYAFSTNTEIYIRDTQTGKEKAVTSGGGYDTDPVWSPDGSKLCWISMERDGYEADKQRLMVADIELSKDGSAQVSGIRDLTVAFKYNATSPVWSDDSGKIYFSALAEGLQGIFRTGTEKGDTVERLTGDDLWYDFDSPFMISETDEGMSLLTTWCSMDFPTEMVRVDIRGGKVSCTQVSDENGHILSQLAPHRTEARMIKTVDGKDMLTWVLYPPEFDASKTYPAIEICLGGPQGTLSQGWSYRWNYRLMTANGYVVILPNRRGTTAFGQPWTEQISGDYCGLNMQDYLCAAKEMKTEPYIGKLAACGASYGGYSVYYLCGVHGNTYDAFIAHAGIFNQEHMYMTTEEMWFPNWDNGGLQTYQADSRVGTSDGPVGPDSDGVTFGGIRQGGSPWSKTPKAVRHYANSPHKLVTNWHTPLLVIHGGMDFRVPVEQGMAAYNAAQMMGVPSKLIVFPDENHWILKPQNALFWHREYFGWLDRWCK